MKVFRTGLDVDDFQYFLLAVRNQVGREPFLFDGRPIRRWEPPDVYSYQPLLKEGDFWGFELISAVWATTPEATELLYPYLQMAGQVLPLPYQGRTFGLLNVTACVDCLDHGRTEWVYGRTTGAPIRIARYAFHEDRFSESSIFKIPELARGYILCYEGLKDPADEFKPVVEALGLTGITFELVWESP